MKRISFNQTIWLPLVIMVMMSASLIAQNTPLPYFNGFENQQDTAGWTFKRRRDTSGFEVGNAAHCLGQKAMYISPDSGRTASYKVATLAYVSIAYRSFTLPAGRYTLAFDYMLGGDGTNQDMKVAFAPTSTTLSAASLGTYPDAIEQNQLTDTLGNDTFGKSKWCHVMATIIVEDSGSYNLCFAFRTNSSTDTPPGACVDNIQIDTLKSAGECTSIPDSIQCVIDPQMGVIISWQGNAMEYELIATSLTDPQGTAFCHHTGITTTSDTIDFAELTDGQYTVYVRAICGNDTSLYAMKSGLLIYDPSNYCIDYLTFNSPKTYCTYGTYPNPFSNVGYIDNGPDEVSSRHTLNTELGEYDIRTNNALPTIPPGELASVRLGNWNNNYEAEAITYTYDVPNCAGHIVKIKYAVIAEDPSHNGPSEFYIELLDANGQRLDSACTYLKVLYDPTQSDGWHSCTAIDSYSSLSIIYWKEWSTYNIDVSPYAGQSVKIRLVNKDCNSGGHFGYTYFTICCAEKELTAEICGQGDSVAYTAPEGFKYQWINNCTDDTVSTSRTYTVAMNDTCLYSCICWNSDSLNCQTVLTINDANVYRLVVVSNDETLGTATGSGLYPYDTQVVVTATANDGYEFYQWNDGDTTNPRTLVVKSHFGYYVALFRSVGASIDNVSDNVSDNVHNVKVEKIVIDGVMYILRNGQLYTMTGIKVK